MSEKDQAPESSSQKAKIKSGKKSAVPFMQNRELSWLDFNKRVLDQGADPSVPLLERLGFVSIYWSNLQEFFMIRVGSLTDLSLLKKPIIDSKSNMSVEEQLSAIYRRCHELNPYYEECYDELSKQLAEQGIVNVREKQLSDEQRAFVSDWFHANIMPFLSPQIVNPRHPFPHLENGALYVVVRLGETAVDAGKKKDHDKGKVEKLERSDKTSSKPGKKTDKQSKGKGGKGSKNMGAEGVTIGIIPMPKQCSRIIPLPGEGTQFILLEHAVEMFVHEIYSMYKVKHTNVICVTRNADLNADEGAEEQGEDYREHIKKILKKRTRLMPVRLESERELSAIVKPLLLERLGLHDAQTFVSKVPLDMSYVFELSSMVDEQKRANLTYAPFSPQWPESIDAKASILDQAAKKDILLSYPYESMDAFVQMLREAAHDPSVVSIKITLYRLAKRSHLAEALIAAAEAGKEVTALFELRARFDESNNIEWSQRFEEAGCNVIYGFRDYKVHSKICCITRRTNNGLQYITQLGTGNYNEKTARLYTDFSFITSDPDIGFEAAAFFRNMTLENISDEYKTLWVAPLQIKQNIMAGIDEQIALANAGKPASIFFKTNSITDKELIDKIVEASQAGVQCTLLVRGISCLVPGIPGYTDNVCVVSIVGRLLEHSRIYIFGSFDSDFKVYLSSADLMTRNMDKRIEIAWPITSPDLRNEIVGYIGTCMADTAKLRDLLPNRTYTDIGFFAKPERQGGEVVFFDSQNYLIEEAQGKNMIADEVLASKQGNDKVKIRELAVDEIDLAKIRTEAQGLEAAKKKATKGKSDGPQKDKPKKKSKGKEDSVKKGATEKAGSKGKNGVDEKSSSSDSQKPGKKSKGTSDDGSQLLTAEELSFAQTDVIDIDKLPGIDGLYSPEVNLDGTFTIPGLSGETVKLDRVGGPVLEGEEKPGAIESEAVTEVVETTATEDVSAEDTGELPVPTSKPILGTPEGSPFVEIPDEPSHVEIPTEKDKPSLFKRLFKKGK